MRLFALPGFIIKLVRFILCGLAIVDCSNGDELFLTPLIQNGNYLEAQRLAEVKELIPNDSVKSYSGFITVNNEYNTNLFFWYFPAVNNPESAPVLLFNDGGPGACLMNSLLAYVGPYKYNPMEKAFEHRNDFSFNVNINTIFVDNPAGVGFSFTENEAGYPTSGREAAPDMYEFLVQFFEMFPDLQQNDFYNGGASFGGIYSTSLAHLIHEKNSDTVNPPRVRIPLKGLILDSPWLHASDQLDYSTVLYGFGLLDERTKQEFEKKQETIGELLRNDSLAAAVEVWMELLFTDVIKSTGYASMYNMLTGSEGSPLLHNYTEFVERESTRSALHVGNRKFNLMGAEAAAKIHPNFMYSVKPLLDDLVDSGKYKVIAYGGNLDVITHHVGVQKVMDNLNWNGSEEFRAKNRSIWMGEGGRVSGYVKSHGNLTTVLVRNASHGSGIDAPESVWKLVNAFVENDDWVERLVGSNNAKTTTEAFGNAEGTTIEPTTPEGSATDGEI